MQHDNTRPPHSDLPPDDEDSHGGSGTNDGTGADPRGTTGGNGPHAEDHAGAQLEGVGSDGEDEAVSAEAIEAVERIVDARVQHVIQTIEQSIAVSSMSSGPLPTGPDLYEYTPEHQERIVRMAESVSTDESARRDQVTTANIRTAATALWSRNGMFAATLALAFISFWLWQNVIFSALFVSLPVLQVVGTTIHSTVAKRESPKKPGE